MKNFLLLFLFSLLQSLIYSQDIEFKEFSYSQLFQMIEEDEDTIFSLEMAFIKFNPSTDSLFQRDSYEETDSNEIHNYRIIVDKHLKFENVHFFTESRCFGYGAPCNGIITKVRFNKSLEIRQSIHARFDKCLFVGDVEVVTGRNMKKLQQDNFDEEIEFYHCIVDDMFRVFVNFYQSDIVPLSILVSKNIFRIDTRQIPGSGGNKYPIFIFGRRIFSIQAYENVVENGDLEIRSISNQVVNFTENIIKKGILGMSINDLRGFANLNVYGNSVGEELILDLGPLKPNHNFEWSQFNGNVLANDGLIYGGIYELSDEVLQEYQDSIRYHNMLSFKNENALRGLLYRHYQSKMDRRDANAVYIDLKNLETERLRLDYKDDPSFDTFFQWKVNQFLKIFSNYGTKPSKAIVFSLYVILLFAFIYLFFPNSWDSHGKNRIIDRYTFFMKYLRQKAGVHEVYMEEKKPDLMAYDDFRTMISESEQSVPKFFTATALPLYKWAISGTRLSSAFLKRVDVMQGSWNDVPKKKRWWKRLLLIGAFSLAIVYDLLIKMLNALMLSINTFTTLGFGEIPIKGLPRYLAIIQGFIGWFMLTIFSVSLISQLLN